MKNNSRQIRKTDSDVQTIKKLIKTEIFNSGIKPSNVSFARNTSFVSGTGTGLANTGNAAPGVGLLASSGGQNQVFLPVGGVGFGGSDNQITSSFDFVYNTDIQSLSILTTGATGHLEIGRTTNMDGTVTIAIGDNYMEGVGTLFSTRLRPGDSIIVDGETFIVQTIANDTELYTESVSTATYTAETFYGESTIAVNTFTVQGNGNVGVGTSTPTARLHLTAGNTYESNAPLKFTSGSLLDTPEVGAVEYNGTNYYATDGTGTRRPLSWSVGLGTTNRVPFYSATGILTDSANFTYTTGTGQLALATTGSAAGILIGGDANLYRNAANELKTDDALVVTGNLTVSTLTTTRVPFASTAGLLVDSANFTYTTGTGQLALATTGSGGGLLVGGDVQWYRNAANVWRTPDAVTVDGAITASSTLTVTGGQLLCSYATFPQIYINSAQHAAIYLNRLNSASYTTQFRFLTGAAEKWRFGSTASNEDLYYTYYNGSSWVDAFRLIHNTGQVYFPVTGSGAGLVIGGDTQIYRSAADVLRTPDQLLIDRAVSSGVVTLSDGATPALNAALGNTFVLTAAGDRTIAVPTNPTSGQVIIIVHTASGGARTLALNTGAGGFAFGTTITALTATTSGLTDYITCIYDATSSKWRVISYEKGF